MITVNVQNFHEILNNFSSVIHPLVRESVSFHIHRFSKSILSNAILSNTMQCNEAIATSRPAEATDTMKRNEVIATSGST